MSVARRPCSERALTLAIRTAMLSSILAAGSATAWAADPKQPEQQDAAATEGLTLDTTNVNARYNGATALPEVLAGGQVARGARLGMMGNKDVMDTPFSVTSYTAKTLADLQTVTVADALERDPSVRSTGQTGGIVDSFFIRGFAIGEGNLGELAYDGVYGVAPNYRVFTEYAERVEVLKGPGALMYGISPNSGVGGVINIVPKRPLAEDLTRFTGSYASDSQVGGHLDISRRFGDENQFGVRFNGSLQGGDTAVDDQERDLNIGAIALDYQGERLRLNLDFISQKESFEAASRPFTIAPGVEIPSAPNGRTNLPQDWGWSDTKEQSALLGGEYDLNDNLTVFAHAGGGRSDVKRMSDQVPRILNDAGDTSNIPGYYKFNVDRSTPTWACVRCSPPARSPTRPRSWRPVIRTSCPVASTTAQRSARTSTTRWTCRSSTSTRRKCCAFPNRNCPASR